MMLKRSIKLIIFALLISLTISLNVDAEEIYSKLQSGDIVIGNTIFRETWVSSTRAAKAGALYTKNTGSTDINTYKYINVGTIKLWYVYNTESDDYQVMTQDEITNLESELAIYYNNNEALMNTYDNYQVYEFFYEFRESEYLELYQIYSDQVEIDEENYTITCPYDHEFLFDVIDSEEYIETFVGKCNTDGSFTYEYEAYANQPALEIETIDVSSQLGVNEMANQSKIMAFDYESYYESNEHDIHLAVLGELEEINWPYSEVSKKWIGIDITFVEGSMSFMYEIFTNSLVEYRISEIDPENIQLWINAEDLLETANRSANFIILDEDGNREDITVSINQYSEENTLELNTENFVQINQFFKGSINDEYVITGASVGDYDYGMLYFDQSENKLYISNAALNRSDIIFADDEGLKVIKKLDASTYKIEEFVGYAEGTNTAGTKVVAYLDLSSFLVLDENIQTSFFDVQEMTIDYFFNRELTEEEQAKIEYLAGLENVIVNNYSDYFYSGYEAE